jgi:FkbM family methyltransferase
LSTQSLDSRNRFEHIFAEIHREDIESRSRRWRNFTDNIAGPIDQVVLFGSGEFGQWTLKRLRRAGVEPICFSDNNQSRWGTKINGVEVLSPSDAVKRLGSTAIFVVTIYNGSAARNQLRQMHCKRVLSAATLFWKYPGEFMPDIGIDSPELLAEQEAQIRHCFELLSDERSRHEFCDQIQWRYWFDPEFLPLPQNTGELYFPDDLVRPNENEVFVDCGAYDGDTIRTFLRRGQHFHHVYALEPDSKNRAALQTFLDQQDPALKAMFTVEPYAVSDSDGTLVFTETHDVTSKVSTTGEGIVLECRRLDSMEWPSPPTYIKMDIEGSEPQALAGGSRLIQERKPVLAICLYHRSEHFWQIPNFIYSLAPEYSIFLRRYAEDCWETVCYAVPQERLVSR